MGNVIGKKDQTGAIEIEADTCAVTGRPVLGQHLKTIHFNDTPYFIRVLTAFAHQLTPERKAELLALALDSSDTDVSDEQLFEEEDQPIVQQENEEL